MDKNNSRFYRNWIDNNDLQKFTVTYKETDLLIRTHENYSDYCYQIVKELRNKLDKYIQKNKSFKNSLKPVKVPQSAPASVKKMAVNSKKVNVGPMATVAGLFARRVGEALLKKKPIKEAVVENGGDIFLSLKKRPVIGIYAGEHSPFTNKLSVKLTSSNTPLGICTSAGTIGSSFSDGEADAVIVVSPNTILADAAATALGNRVKMKSDIQKTIDYGKKYDEITGLVIIKDDKIGMWGELEIVSRED